MDSVRLLPAHRTVQPVKMLVHAQAATQASIYQIHNNVYHAIVSAKNVMTAFLQKQTVFANIVLQNAYNAHHQAHVSLVILILIIRYKMDFVLRKLAQLTAKAAGYQTNALFAKKGISCKTISV